MPTTKITGPAGEDSGDAPDVLTNVVVVEGRKGSPLSADVPLVIRDDMTDLRERATAAAEVPTEKPRELVEMIENMTRTADEVNNFYNFGSEEAMLEALNTLPGSAIEAIVEFTRKLNSSRTDLSFPILVDTEGAYLLTQRAPSASKVNIKGSEAKAIVEEWGYQSPDEEQWRLLERLGLVDKRLTKRKPEDPRFYFVGTPKEWLPHAKAAGMPGFFWQANAVSKTPERAITQAPGKYGYPTLGVRALKSLKKE